MTTKTPTYKTWTDHTGVWTHITRTSDTGQKFDSDTFGSRADAVATIRRYAKGTFVVDGVEYMAPSGAAAILGRIGGSKTSERKTEAVRENGKQGGRPQSDYATKFHRNGEVTVWDVYQQRWTRLHVSRVSDQVLSSLDHDERARILNHRERNQTADE